MDPVLFLGALVVVSAWVMAALANARSAEAPAARRVALLLFVLGADVATSRIGLARILPPQETDAVLTVHFMLDAAVPPLTLIFMARALDTPVARALRRRTFASVLGAFAVAGPAAAWIAVHQRPSFGFIPYLFGYITFGFLVGFFLALQGWRGAEGLERRRAGMFAVAFGVLDVAWGLAFGIPVFARPEGLFVILELIYGGGALAFALVLGYAILQHRLLGIDVKLRFAISKSTVAAVFIAVFFVASEAAQQFLGQTLGSTYVGIAAAGALVFAMAPLQRAAERLAEKAVPPTATHPEREEVYRNAVRLAMRDRRLTRSEERDLFRLAHGLGLELQRAHEILTETEGPERGSPSAAPAT